MPALQGQMGKKKADLGPWMGEDGKQEAAPPAADSPGTAEGRGAEENGKRGKMERWKMEKEGNGLSWGWFVGVCLELDLSHSLLHTHLPLLNYLAGSKNGEIVTALKPANLGLLC